MNLQTVSASEEETAVVTEQEATQDTKHLQVRQMHNRQKTEQTSEQFTSETETEEQIPDSIEVAQLNAEIQNRVVNG